MLPLLEFLQTLFLIALAISGLVLATKAGRSALFDTPSSASRRVMGCWCLAGIGLTLLTSWPLIPPVVEWNEKRQTLKRERPLKLLKEASDALNNDQFTIAIRNVDEVYSLVDLQSTKGGEVAFVLRGLAHYQLENYGKAQDDFLLALKINPEYVPALTHLAWLEATCPNLDYRDAKSALVRAKMADRLFDPKRDWELLDSATVNQVKHGYNMASHHWRILDTIAAARASQGYYAIAEMKAELADSLYIAFEKHGNRKEVLRRIENYRNRKPFYERPAKSAAFIPPVSNKIISLDSENQPESIAHATGTTKQYTNEPDDGGKEDLKSRDVIILEGPTFHVQSMAFSPDSSRLAASFDDVVMVWDVASHQPVLTTLHQGIRLKAILYSTDGKRIAAGTDKGGVLVFDANSGTRIQTLENRGISVRAVTFSPDGQYVAACTGSGKAAVWDTTDGRRIFELDKRGFVTDIRFTPDGRRLIIGGSGIQCFDARTGEFQFILPFTEERDRIPTLDALAMFPVGNLVAFVAPGGFVAVYDLDTQKIVHRFPANAKRIVGAGVGQNGRWIASRDRNGSVTVWNMKTQQRVGKVDLSKRDTGDFNVALSQDGRRIAIETAEQRDYYWRFTNVELREVADIPHRQ